MKKRPGNELSLYCLCKMYNRHATIYTFPGYWTTLQDDSSESEVCAKSDIILLYLGKNKFCKVSDKMIPDSSKTQTKRKRVTKSISELVQNEMAKQTETPKRTTSRVKLNPTKHDHNTQGSVRQRHNVRPGRNTTAGISYVPDLSSSDESEPSCKHQCRPNCASPTRQSGPSETRIRAQEIITRNKLQTKENVHTKLIGTYIVSPTPKIKQETELQIKLKIKQENSKPLTKQQKERRRRRNLRELKEYDWEHVHYKSGKGILCCDHAKGAKSKTNNPDTPNKGHDEQAANNKDCDKPQTTDVSNSDAVNTENAKELTESAINNDSQITGLTQTLSTLNIMVSADQASKTIAPESSMNCEPTTNVNTENNEENQASTLLSSVDCEVPKMVNTDNNIYNTDTLSTVNPYDADTDTESYNKETPDIDPVNTENNNNVNSETNTYREKEAVDGLLLLSGSEDTMDEY